MTVTCLWTLVTGLPDMGVRGGCKNLSVNTETPCLKVVCVPNSRRLLGLLAVAFSLTAIYESGMGKWE